MLTTVQDGGRRGLMASGFSPCGALDTRSLAIANLLVGNRPDEATLEMTLLGITAQFTSGAVIALAGADFSPMLNGIPLPMYTAVAVKGGDTLICQFAKTGCRAYLAVSGGFDIPEVLGSRSTYLKCGIGGFEGRKLAQGDELVFREKNENAVALRKKNKRFLKDLQKWLESAAKTPIEVRAIPGPQDVVFAEKGVEQFFSQTFTVSNQSDRMGIRLEGEPIVANGSVDIISDGIALGSVQVPSSGKPIILLADRQTTGGYAKIATVISADIPLLAQARPGDSLRFYCVTVREAQRAYRREERIIRKLA
jgi:biotin-dependent carboxylase-like uncharacterized protein